MEQAASKALLRAEAAARRRAVSEAGAAAFARRIRDVGSSLVAEKAAATVAAYWPVKDEASPVLLLETLAAREIATALPVVVARGEPLLFRRWRPGETLVKVGFGLEEPQADAPEVVPDLLFVPLLAFDRSGHRLGYGAGFYDRTLAKLRDARGAVTVGIAYAAQELPEIPAEPHDQRLDYILTERELITAQNG
jgi:5-formyltetrahydrofolate cyclo-ligase